MIAVLLLLTAPAEYQLALDWPAATADEARSLQAVLTATRPGSWTLTEPTTSRGRGLLVRVREIDRRFRVETTPFDARHGTVGPAQRQAVTADRGMVPRLIAAAANDLGPVGVVAAVEGETARVRLSDGTAVNGQVFAVFQGGRRIPGTLLRMTERDGETISARILSRYVNPLTNSDKVIAVGLVGDVSRVKIFITNETNQPANDLSIRVSPTGFATSDTITERGPARHGRYESTHEYDSIAYVTVLDGERPLARVPVEVIHGAIISINVRGAGADPITATDDDARNCRRRLHELTLRLFDLNEQLKPMLSKAQNAAARDAIRSVIQRVETDLPALKAEAGRLRPTPGGDELSRAVADIEAKRDEFIRLASELDRASRTATTPAGQLKREQLLALVRRAEREADDADYDKALATYGEVLTASGDWPEVRKRRDELAAAWVLRDGKHRKAREFVYQKFGRGETAAELTKQVTDAKSAMGEFKRVSDKLSPRKLYLELIKLADRLGKMGDEARADAVRLAEVKELAAAVQALFSEVEEAIRAG